jgi:hypothetical protein
MIGVDVAASGYVWPMGTKGGGMRCPKPIICHLGHSDLVGHHFGGILPFFGFDDSVNKIILARFQMNITISRTVTRVPSPSPSPPSWQRRASTYTCNGTSGNLKGIRFPALARTGLYVHGDTRAVLVAVCNVPSIKHRFLVYIKSLGFELADPRIYFYGFRTHNVRQAGFPFRGKSTKLVIPQ